MRHAKIPLLLATFLLGTAAQRQRRPVSSAAAVVPEVMRKAFRVATLEKPGPTHIELPEDVMGEPYSGSPLRRQTPAGSEPSDADVSRAARVLGAAPQGGPGPWCLS